jgi:SHNi-TPR
VPSADVHMLLGDLSSENDAFAEALEDYRVALELLDKRLPEVRRLCSLLSGGTTPQNSYHVIVRRHRSAHCNRQGMYRNCPQRHRFDSADRLHTLDRLKASFHRHHLQVRLQCAGIYN